MSRGPRQRSSTTTTLRRARVRAPVGPPPLTDPAPASVPAEVDFSVIVNGRERRTTIDPRVSLLDVLRDHLDLTEPKQGCHSGACGSCTILLDGRRINACLTLAVMHEGATITTIEGFAGGDPLRPLQTLSGAAPSPASRASTDPPRPFEYFTAKDEAEAIARAAAGARYIAGGTSLIDLMREDVERPGAIVDINRLALRDIGASSNLLSIGALARMSDVAAHPEVARRQPLIAQALLDGASPQLRNMATIGGNLLQRVRCPYFRATEAACNKRRPGSGCAAITGYHANHAIFGTSERCIATHPSDLAVALVALDARVCVRGPRGERFLPIDELYRLPGNTPHLEHTLEPGELIVAVDVPCRGTVHRACYLKVRDRDSDEFAVVSVAVDLDIADGVIRAARLAAGGVGTKPWRLHAAELAITGEQPAQSVWTRAGAIAVAGATPLPDNAHKVELLRRTIVRALASAAETC